MKNRCHNCGEYDAYKVDDSYVCENCGYRWDTKESEPEEEENGK